MLSDVGLTEGGAVVRYPRWTIEFDMFCGGPEPIISFKFGFIMSYTITFENRYNQFKLHHQLTLFLSILIFTFNENI